MHCHHFCAVSVSVTRDGRFTRKENVPRAHEKSRVRKAGKYDAEFPSIGSINKGNEVGL